MRRKNSTERARKGQQMNFFDDMSLEAENSFETNGITENGAIGYRSAGHPLVDLNFAVSSMRKMSDEEVINLYRTAYDRDPQSAIVWLFFARDIRGGMGERRLFRTCMNWLARTTPQTIRPLLPLISHYGRWDDLLGLYDTPLQRDVLRLIVAQLREDHLRCNDGLNISLLAKWMPSENASSPKTREMAARLRCALYMSPKTYRVLLSRLRKHLRIVERQMSEQKWSEIDYTAVPSRANMLYGSAFLRHDRTRRRQFLSQAEQQPSLVNASTVYPHEIVHRYGMKSRESDPSLEAMWKSLPFACDDAKGGTLVVADGSGSMKTRVSRDSSVLAIDIARALAIFFAERLNGPFRNRFVTFSSRPRLADLRKCSTLREKIDAAARYNEADNTNIEAVFNLILDTAVHNHLPPDALPHNVLIISDMEFDACTRADHGHPNAALFAHIGARFRKAGYRMPRLIFWNVTSRSRTIPIRQNENGVALVSGFSPSVIRMVMSNRTEPYEVLMETLHGSRYEPVWRVLQEDSASGKEVKA